MAVSFFKTKNEMMAEMNKLGESLSITKELIKNHNHYFLTCANQVEEKCEACIFGMFNQNSKNFCIKKIESTHSCSLNQNREQALQSDLKNVNLNTKRTGEIVERLFLRYKASYFEVFKCLQENIDDNKENLIDPGRPAQKDYLEMCLAMLSEEFESINTVIKARAKGKSFYFKHTQMHMHLRNISELKLYSKGGRTFIYNSLFDYNNDKLISSCLISDDLKTSAIKLFLDFEAEDQDDLFYLVELDWDLIDILKSRNIRFFMKSRAVCDYLINHKENELTLYEHYQNLNYGSLELLDISKEFYLRRYCDRNMFNLNNTSFTDFEFMTSLVYSLPLVDVITSHIWLISDDLKNRKLYNYEVIENKLPEYIVDIIDSYYHQERNNTFDVDLDEGYCSCGRFQFDLYPCIHAFWKIKDLNKDPILYVSSVYSRDKLMDIVDIVPVVDIKIYYSQLKHPIKK